MPMPAARQPRKPSPWAAPFGQNTLYGGDQMRALRPVPFAPGQVPGMPYASRGYPTALGATRGVTQLAGRTTGPSGSLAGYGGVAAPSVAPQASAAQMVRAGSAGGVAAANSAAGMLGSSRAPAVDFGMLVGDAGPVIAQLPTGRGGGPMSPFEAPGLVGATAFGQGMQDTTASPFSPESQLPVGSIDEFRSLSSVPGPTLAQQMRARAGKAPPGANSALQALAQATGVPLAQSMAAVAGRPNRGVLYDPQNQSGREPTGGVGSFGSLNPYAALANDPNAQMYADPANVNAQFSTSGFRTADGQLISQDLGALSALAELRRFGPDTRESLVNAANNRGRQLAGIVSGINDPNYNADGRWFQGAGVGQDAQGRTYFRDQGPVPTGTTPEQREAARIAHLTKLQAQGKGYLDETTGQFIGRAGDATTNPAAALAYTTAGERSKAMAASQAERMKLVQQRAAQMADERKQRLADRKRGPSVLDMMMQRNPELATRVMALQQQGQLAQAQMQQAERMQQAGFANAQQLQQGQLAGQMQGIQAQVAGALEEAKQRGASARELAEIEQKGREAVANIQAKTAADDRTAQVDASRNKMAGDLAALYGQLEPQQQAKLAPVLNELMSRIGGFPAAAANQQGQPAAAAPPAQGPFPTDPATDDKPIYAGGKINEAQLKQIKDAADDGQWQKALTLAQSYGLSQAEAENLVNGQMVGNTWWRRTEKTPSAWSRFLELFTPNLAGYDLPPADYGA